MRMIAIGGLSAIILPTWVMESGGNQPLGYAGYLDVSRNLRGTNKSKHNL